MIGCMTFKVAELLGPNKVTMATITLHNIYPVHTSPSDNLGVPYRTIIPCNGCLYAYNVCLFLCYYCLQGLNGWYQFLDASKGRNENVQVASKFTSPNNRPKEQQFAVS